MTVLTHHGGRIDAAAALYPHAPRPWLDLSTVINPVAWEPPASLTIDLRALPSPVGLANLEAAAAAYFGTASNRVAALPGTEIGLRLLRDLDLPSPVRYRTPAYRTHAEAFDGAIPIDAIGDVTAGTLLIANPNNPDGRIVPPADLLALARRGTTLVIDEAFADTDPAASILPHIENEDIPIIILRSFGKFFGLAGVRLGFAVGPVRVIDRIRDRLGSWPVSSTALAIGTAAYRDADWIADTRADLRRRADAFDQLLARHGLTPSGACPLFRLVEIDGVDVLFERLAQAGILTRPFDDAPRWLRFGVPSTQADLDCLDRALAHG